MQWVAQPLLRAGAQLYTLPPPSPRAPLEQPTKGGEGSHPPCHPLLCWWCLSAIEIEMRHVIQRTAFQNYQMCPLRTFSVPLAKTEQTTVWGPVVGRRVSTSSGW